MLATVQETLILTIAIGAFIDVSTVGLGSVLMAVITHMAVIIAKTANFVLTAQIVSLVTPPVATVVRR